MPESDSPIARWFTVDTLAAGGNALGVVAAGTWNSIGLVAISLLNAMGLVAFAPGNALVGSGAGAVRAVGPGRVDSKPVSRWCTTPRP